MFNESIVSDCLLVVCSSDAAAHGAEHSRCCNRIKELDRKRRLVARCVTVASGNGTTPLAHFWCCSPLYAPSHQHNKYLLFCLPSGRLSHQAPWVSRDAVGLSREEEGEEEGLSRDERGLRSMARSS